MIPEVNYESNGDYTFKDDENGTSRNSNFDYALKGQLKKVIYPTSGYSEFEYEPHYYSKRMELRSVNNFRPSLYNANDIAGGTRIKKIIDFDGISHFNSKEYKYISDYSANTGSISSGIMFQWPRYHSYYSCPQVTSAPNYRSYRRSNPIGNILMYSPVIAYSEVTEVLNGNGFKVSKYSDFTTTPDLFNNNIIYNSNPCNPDGVAANYIGNLLNDRSGERGKILTESVYDVNSVLKQFSSFTYNVSNNKFNNFSTRMHVSGNIIVTNKIYFYNDYLTQKITNTVNSSGQLINTENFIYNSPMNYSSNVSSQDVLIKKNVFTSINNELIETQYKYPWDIYLPSSTNLLNFKNANISLPLSESQFKNSIKLSEKFTTYERNISTNNILLPKNIYSAKFPNNLLSIPDIGNLEKKVTYDLYDAKSNLVQYTQENGYSTSIIWGYNKTLPVAKIENATFAQVAAALGTDSTGLQNYDESNLVAFNGLRNYLSNAMITTYTHKPLIGVTTITDSKGDTNTFTYDSNNRLIHIKDKANKIVSENQYHYKN